MPGQSLCIGAFTKQKEESSEDWQVSQSFITYVTCCSIKITVCECIHGTSSARSGKSLFPTGKVSIFKIVLAEDELQQSAGYLKQRSRLKWKYHLLNPMALAYQSLKTYQIDVLMSNHHSLDARLVFLDNKDDFRNEKFHVRRVSFVHGSSDQKEKKCDRCYQMDPNYSILSIKGFQL